MDRLPLEEHYVPTTEDYESLKIIRSPLSPMIAQALIEVKDFVRKRQLILTGGTAIDFALRLHGDKIYSDETLSFPDLDMYSPAHAEDAYDLADLLYAKGYGDTPGEHIKAVVEGGLPNDQSQAVEGGLPNDQSQAVEGGLPNDQLRIVEGGSDDLWEGGRDTLPASTGVNVIVGVHVQTMRVRLDREVVADISYIPIEIYNNLPYIIYDGMRVIGPHWQMMNIHSAIMYPLSGIPNEAIFKRLKKDLERYNKLYSYYPMQSTAITTNDMTEIKLQLNEYVDDYCLYGFAAYAALVNYYKQILPDNIQNIAQLKIENGAFLSPIPVLECIMDTIPEEITKSFIQYDPIIDYSMTTYRGSRNTYNSTMTTYRGNKKDNITMIIHYLNHGVIPVVKMTIDNKQYIVPNIQSVLLYMLLNYHLTNSSTTKVLEDTMGTSSLYAYYYTSLLTMMRNLSEHAMKMDEEDRKKFILESPFFIPKLPIYGSHWHSAADEIVINNSLRDLQTAIHTELHKKVELIGKPYIPTNYWTVRKTVRPTFDYSLSPYFQTAGLPTVSIKTT